MDFKTSLEVRVYLELTDVQRLLTLTLIPIKLSD